MNILDSGQWANTVWEKIVKKLSVTSELAGEKIPYTTINGKFDDMGDTNLSFWTNGFWSGILWKMYLGTNDEKYKKIALQNEKRMDKALSNFYGLHHDVGFQWLHLSVTNFKNTGDEASKLRAYKAASILASRFNPVGNFLRAWHNTAEENRNGWAIIDCMMNIPILYWASNEFKDPRFKHIAMLHADTVIKDFVKPDGSVHHVVIYDAETGKFLETKTGQGYAVGSSWSRGQGWAIYGFILSYIHTGEVRYLDTAKKIANYFIGALSADFIPNCDFCQPADIRIKDSSAGAIAACGLIEIARALPESEGTYYLEAAINILKALEQICADWSTDYECILKEGAHSYHRISERSMSLIYGDYFFIEAVQKLRGDENLFW